MKKSQHKWITSPFVDYGIRRNLWSFSNCIFFGLLALIFSCMVWISGYLEGHDTGLRSALRLNDFNSEYDRSWKKLEREFDEGSD